MLCNQIANEVSEGFLPGVFSEDPSNVTGHRIRPPVAYSPVNLQQLLFGQSYRDFRRCHTSIIPRRRFLIIIRDVAPPVLRENFIRLCYSHMTRDFADCAILSTMPSLSAVCKFWRTVFDVFIDALTFFRLMFRSQGCARRQNLFLRKQLALYIEAQATASHRCHSFHDGPTFQVFRMARCSDRQARVNAPPGRIDELRATHCATWR